MVLVWESRGHPVTVLTKRTKYCWPSLAVVAVICGPASDISNVPLRNHLYKYGPVDGVVLSVTWSAQGSVCVKSGTNGASIVTATESIVGQLGPAPSSTLTRSNQLPAFTFTV